MLDSEDWLERKRARNREYARRRRARLAAQAQSEPGPVRLTVNPTRAALVRDPETGRLFPADMPKAQRWLKQLQPKR